MVSYRAAAGTIALLFSLSIANLLHAADAPRGAAEYLEGLTALTSGRLEAAAAAFDKAVAADDENSSYHTARAIVLYLQNKPEPAADEIRRSRRLGSTPATQLWGWAIGDVINMPAPDDADDATRDRINQRQRTTRNEFDSRPPYESKEPYAAKLIDAAMHYATPIAPAEREAYRKKLMQIAGSYAWNEMSGPKLVPVMMKTVKSLYDQKKYVDCLALIDRLRQSNANDPTLLYYSAGCKLDGGDLQSAREEYTKVLMQWTQHTYSYLGRARAAAQMGDMERANKDFATAGTLDAKFTEFYKQDSADKIAKGNASVPTEPLPVLVDSLKKTAADSSAPMTAVIEKADRVIRSAMIHRFIASESYTDELQRLDAAAIANPKDADKQAAVGEFLVNPLATRQVRLTGQSGNAMIPCGDADAMRAQQYLDKALAINPNHVVAMTSKALAAVNTGQANVAIQWTEKALGTGANNLDLSRIYLEYYANVAADLNAQATNLRSPKFHTEYRGNVEYTVTTYPSQADLAQANLLDQQAAATRTKAVGPMTRLAESAKGKIAGILASAELQSWNRNYTQAADTALQVFKIDPYDFDAREFLIDLYPKIGMMDKAIEQQNIQNNLANPSAGRTLDKAWDLLAAAKYRSAKEIVDQAETINPAYVYIPAYRAAITFAENKPDEFTPAVRQAVALEEAKQHIYGRSLDPNEKSPLSANDAALPMALRRLWGMSLLSQNKASEAAEQFRIGIVAGLRVPDTDWNNPIQASALPAAENPKPNGWTIRELLMDSEFSASKSLLAAGNADDAGRMLMAYVQAAPNADIPKGTHDLGYQIYTKLGQAKASQIFPQQFLLQFGMLDGQAENRRILQRGDQIDQDFQQQMDSLRQRQTDLNQQMNAASRSRNNNQIRALQQQQQAIDQEMQRLIQQRNQQQMQNIDPNYRGAR